MPFVQPKCTTMQVHQPRQMCCLLIPKFTLFFPLYTWQTILVIYRFLTVHLFCFSLLSCNLRFYLISLITVLYYCKYAFILIININHLSNIFPLSLQEICYFICCLQFPEVHKILFNSNKEEGKQIGKKTGFAPTFFF